MKKCRLYPLILLLAFSISCMTPVLVPEAPYPPPGDIADGDVWKALHSLKFEDINIFQASSDIQAFAAAMAKIFSGQRLEGIGMLFELEKSTADSYVKTQAALLLDNLLSLPLETDSVQQDEGEQRESIIMEADPVEVPIRLGKMGIPIIQVNVEGIKMAFCLDTGSTLTTLDTGMTKALMPNPNGLKEIKVLNIMGGNFVAKKGRVKSFRIGGLEIRNLEVAFMQKKHFLFRMGKFIFGVQGVIGWNALRNLKAALDLRSGKLTLTRKTDEPRLPPNLFWVGFPIVITRTMSGVQLVFGLDTGSNRSFIAPEIAGKISGGRIYSAKVKLWGIGGYTPFRAWCLSVLPIFIDNTILQMRNVISMPVNYGFFVHLDGIIGGDSIRDRQVVIDLPRNRFEIRPPDTH